MPFNRANICVIGDLVTDWFLCNLPKTDEDFDPILSVPVSGGAWFVADVIRAALEEIDDLTFDIVKNITDKRKATEWDSAITQSTWDIGLYQKYKDSEERVFRLRHLNGYNHHNFGRNFEDFPLELYMSESRCAVNIDRLSEMKHDCLIIDDMHLGFRDKAREAEWKDSLARLADDSFVVLIVSGNDLPGKEEEIPPLWDYLQKNLNHKTICIVSANSLRKAGAVISRRISWEATAEDFLESIDSVTSVAGFANKIVRFGITGIIEHRKLANRSLTCKLYYDPVATDGVFRDRITEGNIIGNNSICAAWLVRSAIENKIKTEGTFLSHLDAIIEVACKRILNSSQKFYRHGYGSYTNQAAHDLDEPVTGTAKPKNHEMDRLASEGMYVPFKSSECFVYKQYVAKNKKWETPVAIIENRNSARMDILVQSQSHSGASTDDVRSGIESFALDIVKRGIDSAINAAELEMPIARFGSIVALDRDTIESFRQLESRMRDYVADPSKTKPLNLAAFGAPGSGKSFTVGQIAASASPSIKMMTCNLTLMGNDEGFLVKELIKVLDENRSGKMPLMMFDEFDCDKFMHLKKFLAPMEDGTFTLGGYPLHLGRCIFVFAGGVASTYEQFASDCRLEINKANKATDFSSRLLGHINLLGLDKPDDSSEGSSYVVRRAILLRSFLEKLDVIEHDLQGSMRYGKAKVDEWIIKALLKVYKFRHGARSMRAVLNMCRKDAGRIDKAGIPPDDYIKMHIEDYWNFSYALRNLPTKDSIAPVEMNSI